MHAHLFYGCAFYLLKIEFVYMVFFSSIITVNSNIYLEVQGTMLGDTSSAA